MDDRLAVLPQYALPKQALTAFAGVVASARRGAATTRLIAWFVRKYGPLPFTGVAEVAYAFQFLWVAKTITEAVIKQMLMTKIKTVKIFPTRVMAESP